MYCIVVLTNGRDLAEVPTKESKPSKALRAADEFIEERGPAWRVVRVIQRRRRCR